LVVFLAISSILQEDTLFTPQRCAHSRVHGPLPLAACDDDSQSSRSIQGDGAWHRTMPRNMQLASSPCYWHG
jgi:hypothetical protein